MKILHIIPKLPINKQSSIVGGAANSVINLSNQQKKMGEEVKILSYFPLLRNEDEDYYRKNGFSKINILGEQNSKLYGFEFIIKSVFRSLISSEKFDITHGHSGHIDYLLSSKIISKTNSSHLIYSLYCPLNLNSDVTKYLFRNEYLKIISRDVTFIAISRNIKLSLSAIIPEEKIRIVPPPIDTEKYSNKLDKEKLRAKYNFAIDQPIILFVGNFSKTKNMECVLHAFKKFLGSFSNARLIITTELPIKKFSDRESLIKKLIDELGISNNLDFKGIVDNMPELMKLSDVLVAPFRDTDGPSDYFLAALESMSVGTPTFISPVGGMKEVVNDQIGRFIDPDDPNHLFLELVEFFSNVQENLSMGEEAAKMIRSNFSPSFVENKIKDIYLEVINGKNRSC